MSEYERGAEAAKVAYFAAMEDVRNASDWESLPAHVQTQWRRAARALLGPDAYEYVVAAESLSTAARVVAAGGADDPAYLALQRAILRFENTTWPEFGEDSEDVRFPTPPAPDADPKPDAVRCPECGPQEFTDEDGCCRGCGRDCIGANHPDDDPKPDAVAAARERFTEAAIAEQEARRALGVAMGRPDDEVTDEELRELSAKMDTADDRLNEAYMMLLATEQAEREGGA